jgi:hypothetical protein
MFISERREPLFSFPSLPESVKAGHSNSDLALRPFGLYESDLNVDFNQPLRPFLVTDILECCTREVRGGEVEPGFFWGLPVGKRIECLLTLASSGTGTDISRTFRCPNEECGLELEVEISAEEIAAEQSEAYETERVLVPLATDSVALRRPTADDQRTWLKNRFADERAAVNAMVRSLLLDEAGGAALEGTIPSDLVQAVDRAMEEHDPLVNFSQPVKCSSCGTESVLEIDLEELSLRRLRQAQLRLLASVHSLAAHYHWSESQIFSVPYWRRAWYLSLIEKAKNQ